MKFEVGTLARREDGELVKILYKYDVQWVHYKVLRTGKIEVDQYVKYLRQLSPLEHLAVCAE